MSDVDTTSERAEDHSETVDEALGGSLGIEGVRPERMEIPPEALEAVPVQVACHYCLIPVVVDGDVLRIATATPQALEQLDEVELLTQRAVVPVLARAEHIEEAIKKHYGVGADTIEQMRASDESVLSLEEIGLHSLDDASEDASIIRFVNQVIREAHRLQATDVHFEPQEDTLRIRYRVDGLLEEVPVPPSLKQYQSTIISRIKVMARLDIAEQRLPQDGRIQVRIADEAFDLRVSILPSPAGEAANLRLLRRANAFLGLEQLGFSQTNLASLEASAQRPNGIILVTGPTGSGKTTSLYALLDKISTPDVKTITVEDPVEYNMPGMLQMQVHEEIGFTFARALRSILRHDPDIILVGEIRDAETAEIAIRMAMTGHLVLSTLHTNDAASTIARLIDMGQEPYLLASTIICAVSQRLVRVNCPRCKEAYTPASLDLAPFQHNGFTMPDEFLRGAGCEACRQSGYLGRTGIHELFPIDDAFRDLIIQRAHASRFRDLARQKGIRLMQDDGWDRVCKGLTTIDEVTRVTQAIDG